MPTKVRNLRKTPLGGDEAPDMLYQYLSPLRPFLCDPNVNEVVVNRPGELWTEGLDGWARHEVPELTFENCMQLARLVANFNKMSIDVNNPSLSAELLYHERAQFLIPPATEAGTVSITIRQPSRVNRTLQNYKDSGQLEGWENGGAELKPFEHELLRLKQERKTKEFLELAVQTHRNIVVAGATNSGKTTISKALIDCIPSHERIITIEDVHELFLPNNPNKIHLFYTQEDPRRPGTAFTSTHALKACLRMNPDRILLAELRGDETWDYLQLLNTGHPGSITTVHANGAYAAFNRLVGLVKGSKENGAHLDVSFIRQQIFTTIDIVLYFEERRLREIYYDPEYKLQQMG